MRVLQILILILGFVIFAEAQTDDKSVLTGTVYDPTGAVISKIKVTAINAKGERFEAETDEEGVYVLNLPFNLYDSKTASRNFEVAKYEIIVDSKGYGFEKLVLKDFKFAPSYKGKMNLDFVLEAIKQDCDYGGCPIEPPVESDKREISDKILQTRPLEELPKEQNKSKRKKKINKQ